MKHNHTPGPWTNRGRIPSAPGIPHNTVAAKTLIARVYSEAFGDVENETANARLIAAAPELLQAAQMLIDSLEGGATTIEEAISAIRAAIAKATKEPA